MKILSFFSNPKPKEKPMSTEIKPSAIRAVEAYKKLQAAHALAAAKIMELEGKLAEAKAILDEVFPDNGGSMGGVTE